MISVSSVVKEIIKNSPFFEEGISLGILNLSALAKILKPKIEKKLLKKVSLSSIIVALSRFEVKEKKKKEEFKEKIKKAFQNKMDLILRLNLVEYSFLNSSTLMGKLINFFQKEKRDFFLVSFGSFETTIVFNAQMENSLKKITQGEKIVKKLENLSSLTIRLPEEILRLPGVYYFFLSLLAIQGINVIEIFSTFRELNIILETKEINKAFEILKNAFLENNV